MTREHVKELLPIITAFANGEEIQYKDNHYEKWETRTNLDFVRDPSRYRIKPKPREFVGRLTEVTTDHYNNEASMTIIIPFISNHQSEIVGCKFKITEILD